MILFAVVGGALMLAFPLTLARLLTSSPAVTTPVGEAAHPGPPRSGDERGPGCASNFP